MTVFDGISWVCRTQENIRMGKGGGGTTTTSSTQPPPEVMKQYQQVMGQANQVAQQPLNLYSGQMIAPFTGMQEAAFDSINQAQGIGAPYLNQAAYNYGQSTVPTWQNAQQYMSPYTQNVVDATRANMNQNNQVQNQNLIGQAIRGGAWGGDRATIAQTELARNQKMADDQTISQLYNNAWTTGLGAAAQNAALNQQAAQGYAGLGNQAMNQALQGAGAQLQAGTLQQQLAQQALNVPYQQYQQMQGFPYQNTQWLANTSLGIGQGMGGTSSTTQPGPDGASQAIGNIIGIAGMFLKDGGAVGYADGGPIEVEDWSPFNVPNAGLGFIPQLNAPQGMMGLPEPPAIQQQEDSSQQNMMSGLQGMNDQKDGILQKIFSDKDQQMFEPMQIGERMGAGMFGQMDIGRRMMPRRGFVGSHNRGPEALSIDVSDFLSGLGFARGGYMPGVDRFVSNAYAEGGEIEDPSMEGYYEDAGLGYIPDASSSYVPMTMAPQMQEGIGTPQQLPQQQVTPQQGYSSEMDPGMAISAGGFGMAANGSPHFGVNMGVGGLKAMEAWQKQKADQLAMRKLEAMMGNKDIEHMLSMARLEESKRRSDMADEDRDLARELQKESKINDKVTRFSNQLEKTGIPTFEAQLSTVEDILGKYKDKDGNYNVPGFGSIESSTPFAALGPEGKAARQAVQSLANIIIKNRSGAAVTPPEMQRLLVELGTGHFKTSNDIARGVGQARNWFDSQKKNIVAGVDDDVLQRYEEQGGITLTRPKNEKTLSADEIATRAAKAGISPEDYKAKAEKAGYKIK